MVERMQRKAVWVSDSTLTEACYLHFAGVFLQSFIRRSIKCLFVSFTIKITTTRVQWKAAHSLDLSTNLFCQALMTLIFTFGVLLMLISRNEINGSNAKRWFFLVIAQLLIRFAGMNKDVCWHHQEWRKSLKYVCVYLLCGSRTKAVIFLSLVVDTIRIRRVDWKLNRRDPNWASPRSFFAWRIYYTGK